MSDRWSVHPESNIRAEASAGDQHARCSPAKVPDGSSSLIAETKSLRPGRHVHEFPDNSRLPIGASAAKSLRRSSCRDADRNNHANCGPHNLPESGYFSLSSRISVDFAPVRPQQTKLLEAPA